MICGILHEGSGLGNQLHRYVATRVLAKDKGYDFAMCNNDMFKGTSFMSIQMKEPNHWPFANNFLEKKIVENGVDIRGYDPEFNLIEDDTIIEGEFQDSRYFEHRMDDVSEWLKVEPLAVPNDLCVIGFRGGEYALFPELFLRKEYWDSAIAEMRRREPNIRFEVHTDDPTTARTFFPDFPIVDNQQLSHSKHTNMGYNWRAMRYAKHAIIANSSFYILPRLLAHHDQKDALTIAPRYWARRYAKVWAQSSNYYKQFFYV